MLERQEAADLVGEAWLARLWAEVLQTQDRSILYRQAERHALKLQVEGSGSQSESSATTEVSQ